MSSRGDDASTPESVVVPIIKVDPRLAEEQLFQKMGLHSVEMQKLKEPPEDIKKIREAMARASQMIHEVLTPYMGTILGGQIIDPRNARDIILDRVTQIAEILVGEYRKRVSEFLRKVESIGVRPVNREELVNEALILIEYPRLVQIVLREILNRFITSLYLNAPPHLRPALVNVKIGYDKAE